LARKEALKRNIVIDPDVTNIGRYFNVVSRRINVKVVNNIIQHVDFEPDKIWYGDSDGKPLLHFVMFYVDREDEHTCIPHCELIVEDPEHLPDNVTSAMCRFIVKDELVGAQVYKVFEFIEVCDRLHLLHETVVEAKRNLKRIDDDIQKCIMKIMSDVVAGETFTLSMKSLRVTYLELLEVKSTILNSITTSEEEIRRIYSS
jgi:hypothetical protein